MVAHTPDYQRYLAEVGVGDDRDKAIANAGAKYEQAQKVADEKNLLPTDPIRLGLALNYSVRVHRCYCLLVLLLTVNCQNCAAGVLL